MSQPVRPSLGWPPDTDEAALGLRKIETAVRIDASMPTVHGYATDASRWHEWHPATRTVRDVPPRPLGLGETIVEHIAAGGRRFTTTWAVVAVDVPHLWVIATDAREGSARIVYRLEPDGAATRFRRTLQFRSGWRWMRWLDPLIARWILAPQSRRALDNLRRVIEASPSASRVDNATPS